jgi:isocitrate dehydrogenase kinase/phosphatase
MMVKINRDLHDFEIIVEDFHLKIIVEDHGNEKSLESVAQVHHRHIREQKLPKRLEDFVILVEFANIANSLEDLVNVIEALARDDAQNWKVAMEEEMSFLKNSNTWILSKLLTNCKAIGCKWVF